MWSDFSKSHHFKAGSASRRGGLRLAACSILCGALFIDGMTSYQGPSPDVNSVEIHTQKASRALRDLNAHGMTSLLLVCRKIMVNDPADSFPKSKISAESQYPGPSTAVNLHPQTLCLKHPPTNAQHIKENKPFKPQKRQKCEP